MGRISFSLKYWDARQTHGKSPNFGDELSGWLYRKLLEVPMHADAPAMLYGIGTILQVGSRPEHEPRPDCLKVVLGSGTGDGPCPDISQGWKVYFVRGPLSAQRLGLDPHCAIADPAILVRRFYQPAYSPRHPLGYMPHYWEDFYNGDALRKICANLGLHFISPREEIEKVLDELASCDRLMTESLHGAIIADAFRIPWIPVETSHHFYRFKWRDWMASLGMSYPVCRIRRPGHPMSPQRVKNSGIFARLRPNGGHRAEPAWLSQL
jgi:succinoglycan biosynthesis protein ExoV